MSKQKMYGSNAVSDLIHGAYHDGTLVRCFQLYDLLSNVDFKVSA